MFARARLEPGSETFDAYYEMRPENRASDDRFRSLPGLLSPEAPLAEEVAFASAGASFAMTESWRQDVAQVDESDQLPVGDPDLVG